jgi:hypothetical protein
MKRLLLALLVALLPAQAFGQATVLQGGSYQTGQLPVYSQSGGSQPTVRSSGPAAGTGFGLGELAIVSRGTGTAPFAGQGTGTLGTNFCNYDGPVTGPYHYLCMSPNAQSGGLITYGAAGGASQLPLKFIVNGEVTTWPPTGAGGIGYGVNVTDYGAVCDGVTNDTVAINLAITTASSGVVNFPPRTCAVSGTINIASSGITLNGSGFNVTKILCTGSGTADCVSVGGQPTYVMNTNIKNMAISAPSRSGGSCLRMERVGNVLVNWTYLLSCFNNTRVSISNSVTFQNFWMVGTTGSYILRWDAPSDGSDRSDVLVLIDGVMGADYSGADCIQWDGLAQTMRITNLSLLKCNKGISVLNSGGSSVNVPGFLFATDVEIEGAQTNAVSITAGFDYRFVNSFIANNSGTVGQGGADGDCILVTPDTGVSETRNISIQASQVSLCRNRGLMANARGVHVTGVNFRGISLAGSGVSPVIGLGAATVQAEISAVSTYEFGDSILASYAVEIAAGAQRITMCSIDATGAVTGMVNNPGNVVTFSLCPGIAPNGLGTGLSVGQLAPSDSLLNLVMQSNGGTNRGIINNPGATAGTNARLDLVTGTTGATTVIAQFDGPSPTGTIATGPGTSGGFLIDTTQAAGAGIVLLPHPLSRVDIQGRVAATSYQIVNPFIYLTAPAIASGFGTTPSIVSSNGTSAFRVNVGTGGVATNGTITMPSSPQGWSCSASNIISNNATQFITKMSSMTTTTVVLTNYDAAGAVAAWAASDNIMVSCTGL